MDLILQIFGRIPLVTRAKLSLTDMHMHMHTDMHMHVLAWELARSTCSITS